jgi:hypothetical protein
MAMVGVALLLSGCSKEQESAKVAQKPYPYSEVRMPHPADPVARAESLAPVNRVIQYRSPKYEYGFRYDSSQVRIDVWQSEEGIDLLRESSRVAQVRLINSEELSGHLSHGTQGIEDLRETHVLPDTLFAAVIRRMVNYCTSGGTDSDGGLEMPPTKVIRDTNSNGIRFLKIWCDYVIHWYNKPNVRYPVGPFFCVDVSSPTKTRFLQIMYEFDRATPKDIETVLDSLVQSVEIVR